MLSKSRLLSTLVAFGFIYLGPWVFYTIIGGDFFEIHSTSIGLEAMRSDDQINMPFLTLGCLILAYAMSTLYSKWARGSHSFSHGFEFGAWLGIFAGLSVSLIRYATLNVMDLTGHIVDGIWWIVFYGITGSVISMIYKKTA